MKKTIVDFLKPLADAESVPPVVVEEPSVGAPAPEADAVAFDAPTITPSENP